ncbi:RNA polymerase sigma factor [Bacillus sp. SCS-151]|uniref:RNA polymerase sigma factor n=1 Tax=Nanhaiella sioensis TaxID=3115293 RepID=UPI00397DC097
MKENELIQKSLNGDDEAFNTLTYPYIEKAHQTSFLLLHDFNLAQDAVQEALIQTYISLKRYDVKKGAFKTWFLGIVVNSSLKVSRKKFYHSEYEDEYGEKKNEVESNIILSEEKKHIYNCVKKLSNKYKVTIVMYYFHDMTVKEISSSLKVREGTVKSRLYKARLLLKKMLGEDNSHMILRGENLWKEN